LLLLFQVSVTDDHAQDLTNGLCMYAGILNDTFSRCIMLATTTKQTFVLWMNLSWFSSDLQTLRHSRRRTLWTWWCWLQTTFHHTPTVTCWSCQWQHLHHISNCR